MMMLFYIGYKVSNLLYRAVEDECFFYPHLDKNRQVLSKSMFFDLHLDENNPSQKDHSFLVRDSVLGFVNLRLGRDERSNHYSE